MSTSTTGQGQGIQGQDPKAQVFQGLSAVLYAAESPVSGSYVATSRACAAYADAFLENGLRGAHVLDLGCGYGTTTMAIAQYSPRSIVAVDAAPTMIELMEAVLLSERGIEGYLQSLGAKEVLQDLFPGTVHDLEARRRSLRTSSFARSEGVLACKLLVNERRDLSNLWKTTGVNFDAVIGNNMFHWPVNQWKAARKKEGDPRSDRELVRAATLEGLSAIQRVVAPGGVVVLEEPKDFIAIDYDPYFESDLEAHDRTKHPVFVKLNETLNRILKDRFGKDRAVPTTTGLFGLREFSTWASGSGFEVLRIAHTESAITTDLLMWCYVRLFLWLGSVDISFDDKLRLGREAFESARALITPEDLALPMRCNDFYICLRAI